MLWTKKMHSVKWSVLSQDNNAEWHQQEGEEELTCTSSEERVTECTAGGTHRELIEDKTTCQENQVQKEIEVD